MSDWLPNHNRVCYRRYRMEGKLLMQMPMYRRLYSEPIFRLYANSPLFTIPYYTSDPKTRNAWTIISDDYGV